MPPVPADADPFAGRRPRTVGGVAYLAVVAMTVLGLVLVILGTWRPGVAWIGSALLGGAGARLVIPEASAGMLRVRGKPVDVLSMAALGGTLLLLSVVIPDQPG